MIMEHMHLLERRQDRSFILIAQWHLKVDPQTNLKCSVLVQRRVSMTEDGSLSARAKGLQTFRHAHLQKKTGLCAKI